MTQATRSNVHYQVNRRGGRAGRTLRSIGEGLLELELRARRYGNAGSRIFRWKADGNRYSSRKSLSRCIDAIESSVMKTRRDGEQGRWLLNITSAQSLAVTFALQEGTPFAKDPPHGTCPLRIWHREIHDNFAPVVSYGIYACKYIAGTRIRSQHSYANAEDVHSSKFDRMQAVADYTVEHAERLAVHHVLFNHHIWLSEYPDWHPLNGGDPHTDHVHVDFLPALSGKCRVSICLRLPPLPVVPLGPRRPGVLTPRSHTQDPMRPKRKAHAQGLCLNSRRRLSHLVASQLLAGVW